MDTNSRKDIPRRSRSHCSGIGGHGRSLRLLVPCSHNSGAGQRRKPH
jgi:hypothetical protein